MPRPVKKKPAPKAPNAKRPASDPIRRVHQTMAEHVEKAGEPSPEDDHDTAAIISAYMKVLGTKGGKMSGAKRMEMPEEQRRAIALKAARTRWGKRKV
jgi:hypothetical protein